MKIVSLVVPVMLIALVAYASVKKVKLYDKFAEGAAKAVPTVLSVFPFMATVIIMTEFFSASGLADLFIGFLSPIFSFLGIPSEIAPLVLIKPFSGSGSLTVLSEILKKYGADSYVGRCASAVYGSSETTFYVAAVYFSTSKNKKLTKPIIISLSSTFIATVAACLLCRII